MWNEVSLLPRFFMLFFENPEIRQMTVFQQIPNCCFVTHFGCIHPGTSLAA